MQGPEDKAASGAEQAPQVLRGHTRICYEATRRAGPDLQYKTLTSQLTAGYSLTGVAGTYLGVGVRGPGSSPAQRPLLPSV